MMRAWRVGVRRASTGVPPHAQRGSLLAELAHAHALHQCTALEHDSPLARALCEPPSALRNAALPAVYVGFDPTAAALHLGHLLPLATLLRFRARGWRTVALIGRFTALVGDPAGRAGERALLPEATVCHSAVPVHDLLWRRIAAMS